MKSKILFLVALLTNALYSQSFHDTQGKLDITNSGQATYTLPIAMPASIKDVGPIINLVYASGQMGGIAGQGWSINSISTICRMATRPDIDGIKDGVDFDDNDKLALDGQRLLIKTGTYWANGSTYETEVQSNTKIELQVVGTVYTFIVTNPDGSRTWYGGAGASDLNAFYITRFEDTYGNFMTYHYNSTSPNNVPVTSYQTWEILDDITEQPQYGWVTHYVPAITSLNTLTIAEIKFSANTLTNPTPLNSIKFTYKLSDRKNDFAYLKGEKIQNIDILDKIEVFTNSLLFKKYQLTHLADANGYQRVSQLQEFNGAGEAANPVLFEYRITPVGVAEKTTIYNDAYNPLTQPDAMGDFDGDSHLDFISNGQVYTNLFNGSSNPAVALPFSSTARQLFAATTLRDASNLTTTGYKLNQKQSLVNAVETNGQISFNVYNYNNQIPLINGFSNNYTKTISFDNSIYNDINLNQSYTYYDTYINTYSSNCYTPEIKKSNEYLEGDFNGDGISEVLIYKKINERFYNIETTYSNWNGGDGYNCETYFIDDGKETFLLDLKQNTSITLGENGFIKLQNNSILQGDKKFVMDFNSDGKSDVLVMTGQAYKIISFKQLSAAPWVELEIIGAGTIPTYSSSKPILWGDYNGDGKPDCMIPEANENATWHIYYANPKINGSEFFEHETKNITTYHQSGYDIGNYSNNYSQDVYFALDTNKDGKTDFVKYSHRLYRPSGTDWTNRDTIWRVTNYTNNLGSTGLFNMDYVSPSDHDSDVNQLPVAIASNFKRFGVNNEMVVIRYHSQGSYNKLITFVNFKKNINEDNLLTKVTQSGGSIIDDIIYNKMEPLPGVNNGLGDYTNFYSSTESLFYPYVELKQLPTNWLVSDIQNTAMGVKKYQKFKYHGFAVNINGIGTIGFQKTARSSWFNADNSNKVFWSVTENNPLQRGATIRNFTQLLSTTEHCLYNATVPLINKSENVFTQATDPVTKRYTLLLNKQSSTDYLNNTTKETVYNNYSPDYFLPTSVTNNNYLGTTLQGTSTTTTVFENVVSGTGNNYYIGRPKETTTTTTAYGNTQTINEKYTYTNGNITKSEKKANNDLVTIVEDSDYFDNGLLKSKTISAIGTTAINAVAPKTTAVTYDPSNRFVKTSTDAEGLVTTNISYHPIYGTVLSQQNPFGQITSSSLDNWGKQTRVTDFLNKSINYIYTRVNNIYTTTQTGDDGSSSTVESDALGRVIRKGSKNLNGDWSFVTSEYNYLGQKTRDSEPYDAAANPTQWSTYEYDDYSRSTKTISYTGKIITTTYNGLTVTASEGILAKTKTMNANGHVISATDMPGGTILFKYDALGNLLESDYEGIKNTITYDNWGRKTSLVDTSAGTYTYSYNAFGQPLTETTPKGITTYIYTPAGNPNIIAGKLLTKKVLGLTPADGTNITSTYTYDPTYKWLTNISVVNPNDGNNSYDYGYDPNTKQLNSTIEKLYLPNTTTPYATFTKQIGFDTFGRTNTETNIAAANGTSSTKTTTTVYKNGIAWQIKDGTNLLWQANTTNARGQILTASLGNGINTTNTYNPLGFLTQNKIDNGNTNLMTLNTVFEPIRGNLLTRYNSLFDKTETFSYDSLDRLYQWISPADNLLNCSFDTDIDGFDAVAGAAIISDTGKLKVTAMQNEAGAKKMILDATTFTETKKVHITADYTILQKKSCNIFVTLVQKDPNTGDEVDVTPNTPFYWINYTATGSNITGKLEYDFELGEGYIYYLKFKINGMGYLNTPSAIFTIDNLNIKYLETHIQEYDNKGRITDQEYGSYQYRNAAKPYQQTSLGVTMLATKINPYLTIKSQTITYNAFKAPIQIIQEGQDRISFGYNGMQERCVMYYGNLNTNKLLRPTRRYYSADGSMEITYTLATATTAAKTEFITYIGGDAYSAPIIYKKEGLSENFLYLHRDYQGSIMAITNQTGIKVEERQFDPWGALIDLKQNGLLQTITYNTKLLLDRGYTGHEHLLSVGLINMNARLYDPLLHRFLSPDALIQEPYNTQNYNRYGYCVNNPLKYTDISGNDFGLSLLIAVAVAIATNVVATVIQGDHFSFSSIVESVAMATISSVVTFGIGSAFATTGNLFLKATYSALAHGTFQGGMTAMQGGNFWNGFAAGSLSSIAGSVVGRIGGKVGKFLNTRVGSDLFAMAAGGTGASLTGGNFWQGAVTGLIVNELNHLGHMGDDGGLNTDEQQQDQQQQLEQEQQKQTQSPKKLTYNDDLNRLLELNKTLLEIRTFFVGGGTNALAIVPVKMVRIGKFTTPIKFFHSSIKPKILTAAFEKAGKYQHIVGTNPDILIKGSEIFLTGAKNSPFYGKTFPTGLEAIKFFK